MSFQTKEEILLALKLISPPGDTLIDTLEARGITQSELAQRMGRPIKTINEIVKGKTAIIPESAIQLERVLGIPADFWLNREKNYRLELAEIEEAEKLINTKEWIQKFPMKEIIKLGWIEKTENLKDSMNSIFRFFSIAGISSFEEYYSSNHYATAFRISEKNANNPFAIAAWLRQGELQAAKIDSPHYDKKAFQKALSLIKDLMAKHPKDFFEKLQSICIKVGVKVVHTPCLPKAPISGATRWLGDTPLIQLSGRFKRNDSFWFTFFHEAGHILLHGKKDVFLEDIEYKRKDKNKEAEADEFAIKWTFSEEEEAEVKKHFPLTTSSVLNFAKRFGTHPALIVGRFRHRKIPIPLFLYKLILPVDLDSFYKKNS